MLIDFYTLTSKKIINLIECDNISVLESQTLHKIWMKIKNKMDKNNAYNNSKT